MKLKLRSLKLGHWPAAAGVSEEAGDEADSACVKKNYKLFSYCHWKGLPSLGRRNAVGVMLAQPEGSPKRASPFFLFRPCSLP